MDIIDIAKKQKLLSKSRNSSSSFKKKPETIENRKELQIKVSTSYLKNIFIQKGESSDKDKDFPQINSNPSILKEPIQKEKEASSSNNNDYPIISKPEMTENPSEKDKSTLFSIQTKNQSERESMANNPQDKDLLISQLNHKLNQSARTIKLLSLTNNSQKKALEKLSMELDSHINSASKKMIKNNSVATKETPVDIVIKVKEKELKNAMTLIDILTKDNNNLQMLLNKTGIQEHHSNLIDQLKEKDRLIQSILNDNKQLKKQIEEFRAEIKEKKELEEVVSRIQRDLMATIEDNNKLKSKTIEKRIPNNVSPECINRAKITSPNPLEKFGYNTNKKRNKRIKLVMLNEKSKDTHSFISDIPKANQLTIIPKKSEKLNSNIEKGNLLNKVQELNEKIDYLNRLNKDADQTIKHLQCQANENKIEASIYKRKFKESLEREALLKKMAQEEDSPSSLNRYNKLLKTETTANNIESITSSKKITESFKNMTNE